MEITENCHNCHRPNLINRPAHKDIWCGWCGSEYRRDSEGKIYLLIGKNEHLERKTQTDEYHREYNKKRYSRKKLALTAWRTGEEMRLCHKIKIERIKSRVLIIEYQRRFPWQRWQDISRTWLTVDQVYETRWDCKLITAGGRLAA